MDLLQVWTIFMSHVLVIVKIYDYLIKLYDMWSNMQENVFIEIWNAIRSGKEIIGTFFRWLSKIITNWLAKIKSASWAFSQALWNSIKYTMFWCLKLNLSIGYNCQQIQLIYFLMPFISKICLQIMWCGIRMKRKT